MARKEEPLRAVYKSIGLLSWTTKGISTRNTALCQRTEVIEVLMEAVSSGPHRASGFLSSFKRRLSSTLTFQWGVYSKPSPANTLEVFILFCFCLIIGAAIGGLLHVWMVYSLNYQPFPSMVVSSTWGCIVVLLLLLLHPVRCVLSISVPSLGTKQGRKILISTALVIVVTSCIPNMTRNLSRSVDMIKCSSHRKRLVRTRGWRMTQRELRRCLWGGTILGFYCLVCALVLGLDHLIYSVLQTSLSWAQDIPEVKTTISLRVKITILIIGFIREPLGEMNKEYRYRILLLPPDCVRPLSPPDPSLLATTAALFLTALVMILGEVFSRRIRRKICSSFYRDREEERALYLRNKILLKLEDEGNIS
uniref:Dendritic cell-specific transmembrane protein-like domain-containing protein n=1 Tax=Oncorhynchus tshawytscha TaxID=74940 RepID=A0AAZ3PKN8_ONCTS